jgi:CPA1 family monovalent cation:H+ antiporter
LLTIEQVGLLLLTASVVALLARKAHLPYTVGLVLTGAVLAFSHIGSTTHLTKHLIFSIFLPPLIFEAAISIAWRELRRNLLVILVLATAGVLLAASFTAVGMYLLVGWQWTSALLFGVLIAATDPVSVIAIFREAGVSGRLSVLVEAESLFNDGTAAVGFGIVLTYVQGGVISGSGIALSLVVSVLGGVICGLLVGGTVLLLIGQTQDHLLEVAFTAVAAYGSFLLADHFNVSGVLATLTAGLFIGNTTGSGVITEKGLDAVSTVWEFVAFIVNSLVFLLMGLRMAQEQFATYLVPVIVAIVVVIVGRAISVYSCCAIFARGTQRVSWKHQHVLVWGGLRGALALALVLGLPPNMPDRQVVTAAAFAVVAFSIVVQGLTIKSLINKSLPKEQTALSKGP